MRAKRRDNYKASGGHAVLVAPRTLNFPPERGRCAFLAALGLRLADVNLDGAPTLLPSNLSATIWGAVDVAPEAEEGRLRVRPEPGPISQVRTLRGDAPTEAPPVKVRHLREGLHLVEAALLLADEAHETTCDAVAFLAKGADRERLARRLKAALAQLDDAVTNANDGTTPPPSCRRCGAEAPDPESPPAKCAQCEKETDWAPRITHLPDDVADALSAAINADGLDADDDVDSVTARLEDGASVGERALAVAEHIRERPDLAAVVVEGTDTMWNWRRKRGTWRRDRAGALVREVAATALGSRCSRTVQRRAWDHLAARCMTPRSELGAPPGHVAVSNGLLDLYRGGVIELQPEHRAIRKLPVRYDPEATAPTFRAFLEEVVPDPEARAVLQEFAGYTLSHWTATHETALVLVGDRNAGKSTYLKVLTALLGERNVSSHSVQALGGERFPRADLVGKFANVHADLPGSQIQHQSLLKPIISGDRIAAERKGAPHFEFAPRAKLIFSANALPEVPDPDDRAWWKRWTVVEFPRSIAREEQDRSLAATLTSEGELAGVLNWAVEGFQRLASEGRFTREPTPDEVRKRWLERGAPVQRFVAEALVGTGDPEDRLPAAALHGIFCAWAAREGVRKIPQRKLTRGVKAMENVGYSTYRFDGVKRRGFNGLRVRDEVPRPDEWTENNRSGAWFA